MVAHSEVASGVPVHVVDDTGALLLTTEAMPARDVQPVTEEDVLQKILRGRELPRTGPTTVPALCPLSRGPLSRDPLPLRPLPEPEVTLLDPPEEALDAPSGSALSAVDMTTLFGWGTASSPVRGRHAR